MAAAAQYSTIQMGTARVAKIKGTSSYPTGGYDLTPSNVTGRSNAPFAPVGLNDGGTNIALVDLANKKVKFIVAATGAEVANAVDVSANTVQVLMP